MSHCDKCNLDVMDERKACPLCDGLLSKGIGENVFPYIPTVYKKYSTFFKILYFICTSVSVISLLVNTLIYTDFFFSIFVILGCVCLLLILKITIDNRKDMPKAILWQVFLLSVLSVLWDVSTGWIGWSISYAIPIICTLGSIDMAIVVVVMHIYISEYVFYFLTVAFLGLIPMIFLFLEIVSVKIPSLISIFLNTFVLLFMFILERDVVFTELKRRFHM